MILVADCQPLRVVRDDLAAWQREVDQQRRSFRSHIDAAEREYTRRRTQSAFAPVTALLRDMCSGVARCMYCEDSRGVDVEHYKPKARYPELVFDWANFLLVCARCNRRKSSRFPLLDKRGTSLRASTPADATRRPPQASPVLLNPRVEDPAQFLSLDLVSTFYLVERSVTDDAARLRAKHTVEALELNDDDLWRSRRNAYDGFLSHLRCAIAARGARDVAEVRRVRAAIADMPCSFVWCEMQRQHAALPSLRDAFAALPDALRW